MSEKSNKGGAREGAGRKPKVDEEKTNTIFLAMIKEVRNVTTDDEAKKELAKELFTFERGMMFIAEHVFGKPKETIENINIDGGAIPLTPKEAKDLLDNLDKKI